MVKAVIFDMDGLMIDSEPFHQQAFNAVLREFNHCLTVEENNQRYVGISDIDCAEDLVKRLKLSITPQELVRRKQTLYKSFLQKKVIAQPGLIELLKKLENNSFLLAVASSSTLDEIKIVINKLKIDKYIDFYCSATQVGHGKPAPDIFLFAANRLKVKPVECLVLEDAPSGVKAAKSAGMTVFAIPSQETKNQDFSKADKKISSLSEAYNYIVLFLQSLSNL